MIQLNKILESVCENFRATPEEVKGTISKRRVVYPRAVYSFLALKNTHHTLKRVGQEINKDHSIVVHYRKLVNNLLQTDSNFRNRVETIQETLDLHSIGHLKPKYFKGKDNTNMTKEEIDSLLEDVNCFMTTEEISKKHQVSHKTVYNIKSTFA